MKSKIRIRWMQWHAYLACFFLPISLLYAVTGTLYLFDIKGGVKASFEYTLELTDGWPKTREEAEPFIVSQINQHNHPSLPEAYYPDGEHHSWYGFKQEVILSPLEQATQARLTVKEHDIWHQFLLIHKGHAGKVFWLFGIMLGISLTFSLISGVVLAFNLPKFRRTSILTTLLGLAAIVFAFLYG